MKNEFVFTALSKEVAQRYFAISKWPCGYPKKDCMKTVAVAQTYDLNSKLVFRLRPA